MSTEAQIAANQANSEKSTGPRTEAGKAASSQNSTKHGLTFGTFHILATESQAKYHELLQLLLAEYVPANPTEAILVERMAQHHWLRNRALHLQTQCIDAAIEKGNGVEVAQFNLYMRYETMHERAYRQCLTDVLKLRAKRQKLEIGFASQTHKAELHRIAVRSREAEADYQQTRLSNAQYDAYRQEKRFAAADARENQEINTQKAA